MSAAERRREPRFAPEKPIRAQVRSARRGALAVQALVHDLSGAGLSLEVPEGMRFSDGERVLVYLAPAADGMSSDVRGECFEAEIVAQNATNSATIHLRVDQLSYVAEDDYDGFPYGFERAR
jgi:hypothetical protein